MREREIEQRFKELIEAGGGLCLKWVSPGTAGVPDRIVILPDGDIRFVEFKSPTGALRNSQRLMRRKFLECGVSVIVIDSMECAELIAEELLW